MSANPNKLSQVFQELKRRKVIRVIAMYAGAAYVLIELANNVVAPLNLPDWTPRLVIIIAVIGFPVVFVLSWIFDLTPEGIMKTGPDETPADEILSEPAGKRRLKVSDMIIAVLVILVGILAYPRIFKNSTSLNAMTIPVTVVNEYGEKETRRVFKKDYISRLAIFPFIQEEQDSSVSWLQGIIYDAILEDFLQFENIIIEGDIDYIHLNEQIAFAKTNNSSHFLTGTFRLNNGIYELDSRLYQTINGALKSERTYHGTNVLGLIDSVCHYTRIDLGISKEILNSTPDLPVRELMTDNLDAYRYYIESGIHDDELPSASSFFNLNNAILLDSTFAYALFRRASMMYFFQFSHSGAIESIKEAMRHRNRLSEYREIETRRTYYLIVGETEKAIALAEMQYELKPYDYRLLEDLYNIYRRNQLYIKAEKAAYKLNEIVPGHPPYQIMLARSYLYTGKYSKGLDVLNKLLMDNPENMEALLNMAEICLHMNDLEAAENVINKAILLMPEEEEYFSRLLEHIAFVREPRNNKTDFESYTGKYRDDTDEMYSLISIHNNQLLIKGENQNPFYNYPVSDTVFVTVLKPDNGFLFVKHTFIRNIQEKVKGLITEQNNSTGKFMYWKEDTQILEAKDLLNSGDSNEALGALRRAYEQNPGHYYLAHFIQHLEYTQRTENMEQEQMIKSCSGNYGDLILYGKDNKYYYKNEPGFIYEILPLSEDEFMIPSSYHALIQIIREDDDVTGLQFIYRNGDQEFHARKPGHALSTPQSPAD